MTDARILTGDCRELLAELPAESVQTVVTSPPYWGLRDYGVDGQIGLESSLREWIDQMVQVFREVRRVLRGDGTLWANVGDTYSSGGRRTQTAPGGNVGHRGMRGPVQTRATDDGKPKDLLGVPWEFAFALRADGWYLRQDIIWSKPNPMPESVRDRCTKAHEYLFLLSKSEKYFYDFQAVQEPVNGGAHARKAVGGRAEGAGEVAGFSRKAV